MCSNPMVPTEASNENPLTQKFGKEQTAREKGTCRAFVENSVLDSFTFSVMAAADLSTFASVVAAFGVKPTHKFPMAFGPKASTSHVHDVEKKLNIKYSPRAIPSP